MEVEKLVSLAMNARNAAYAPYSRFAVGAALLTASDECFVGCNVENRSFGLTICAERVAVGNALAAGYREFSRIAIVADSVEPISPCGACRQVLAEFAPNLSVISANLRGDRFESALSVLLPRATTGILED